MNTITNLNTFPIGNSLDGVNIITEEINTLSLLVDGTNNMLADLNMDNHSIKNLDAGVDSLDAVNKSQLDLKADTSYVNSQLALKADKTYVDNNFVNLTSNQTIGGIKTFSNQVVFNGATKTNLSAIDIPNAGTREWLTTGTQTILGAKTFLNSSTFNGPSFTRAGTDTNINSTNFNVSATTTTNLNNGANCNNKKITNLATATNNSDAVNKLQMDSSLNLLRDDTNTQLALKSNITYVDTQLALKADKTYTDTQLALKADKTYTDTQLASKTDKTYTDTQLALKADKTYTDTQLALKADKTYTDTQLELKADKTYTDTQDNLRVLKTGDSINGDLGITGGLTVTSKVKIGHLLATNGASCNEQGAWIDWNANIGSGMTNILNQKGGGAGGIGFGEVTTSNVRTINLFLKADGNLGIGKSNPTEKLDVNGSINFTGGLKVNGSSGNQYQFLMSQGVNTPSWTGIGKEYKITISGTIQKQYDNPNNNPTPTVVFQSSSFTVDPYHSAVVHFLGLEGGYVGQTLAGGSGTDGATLYFRAVSGSNKYYATTNFLWNGIRNSVNVKPTNEFGVIYIPQSTSSRTFTVQLYGDIRTDDPYTVNIVDSVICINTQPTYTAASLSFS